MGRYERAYIQTMCLKFLLSTFFGNSQKYFLDFSETVLA